MVNDESELVYNAFYADIEPINVIKALKDSKWVSPTIEELNSI